tara:strand:- start:1047 stop:1322 length:276 start_codon:yes stop_codon:yes gene_type:complete
VLENPQGFKLGVDPARMKSYREWFWNLYSHFEEDEQVIFPILLTEDPMVKQVFSEHQKLRKLFSTWENPEKPVNQIGFVFMEIFHLVLEIS